MVEVAQSYEMVRNFNNFEAFVTFAMKKLEVLPNLVEKFKIWLCWSGKIFLTMTTFSGKIFTTWSKS
jgi:hypothetical protein